MISSFCHTFHAKQYKSISTPSQDPFEIQSIINRLLDKYDHLENLSSTTENNKHKLVETRDFDRVLMERQSYIGHLMERGIDYTIMNAQFPINEAQFTQATRIPALVSHILNH